MTTPLEKRTWVYVQQPHEYEIAPCPCGNDRCQWSEFKGHLWCEKCQKDFIPEHNGVFEGPIPINAAALLGFNFDRLNLETEMIESWNSETKQYEPVEKAKFKDDPIRAP